MANNLEQPLVSVGFVAYNRPELLRLAIESIVQQSYENLEIIVSDDCSPGDGTRAVVEEFMEKDSRIQYYRQEKNIGEAENMKFVLAKANGKYFMWASEDDKWDKSFVETGIKVLLVDSFYQAWFCSYDVIDTFGRVIQEAGRFSDISCTADRRKNITRYLCVSGPVGKDGMTYAIYERSALANTVDHYFISGKGVQDQYGCGFAFNTAFLARYNIFITDDVLFHKCATMRSQKDEKDKVQPFVNNTYRGVRRDRGGFHPKKTVAIIREHYKAVRGTPYTKLVVFTLISTIPNVYKNYVISRAIRKTKSVTKRIDALIRYLRRLC